MGKTLTQTKREYLYGKIPGSKSATPVNTMEKVYNNSVVGQKQPLKQGRQNWLRSVIVAHGKTPSGSYESDLVKQALIALGLQPSKNLNQNWKLLYQANP